MPTRDGISDKDWDKVREIAVNIANADLNNAETTLLIKQMLDYLEELEARYGRLSSILATKADYIAIEDTVASIDTYREAYELACKVDDQFNRTEISSSLAELYIDHLTDKKNGEYWLDLLSKDMEKHTNKSIDNLYEELKGKIDKML